MHARFLRGKGRDRDRERRGMRRSSCSWYLTTSKPLLTDFRGRSSPSCRGVLVPMLSLASTALIGSSASEGVPVERQRNKRDDTCLLVVAACHWFVRHFEGLDEYQEVDIQLVLGWPFASTQQPWLEPVSVSFEQAISIFAALDAVFRGSPLVPVAAALGTSQLVLSGERGGGRGRPLYLAAIRELVRSSEAAGRVWPGCGPCNSIQNVEGQELLLPHVLHGLEDCGDDERALLVDWEKDLAARCAYSPHMLLLLTAPPPAFPLAPPRESVMVSFVNAAPPMPPMSLRVSGIGHGGAEDGAQGQEIHLPVRPPCGLESIAPRPPVRSSEEYLNDRQHQQQQQRPQHQHQQHRCAQGLFEAEKPTRGRVTSRWRRRSPSRIMTSNTVRQAAPPNPSVREEGNPRVRPSYRSGHPLASGHGYAGVRRWEEDPVRGQEPPVMPSRPAPSRRHDPLGVGVRTPYRGKFSAGAAGRGGSLLPNSVRPVDHRSSPGSLPRSYLQQASREGESAPNTTPGTFLPEEANVGTQRAAVLARGRRRSPSSPCGRPPPSRSPSRSPSPTKTGSRPYPARMRSIPGLTPLDVGGDDDFSEGTGGSGMKLKSRVDEEYPPTPMLTPPMSAATPLSVGPSVSPDSVPASFWDDYDYDDAGIDSDLISPPIFDPAAALKAVLKTPLPAFAIPSLTSCTNTRTPIKLVSCLKEASDNGATTAHGGWPRGMRRVSWSIEVLRKHDAAPFVERHFKRLHDEKREALSRAEFRASAERFSRRLAEAGQHISVGPIARPGRFLEWCVETAKTFTGGFRMVWADEVETFAGVIPLAEMESSAANVFGADVGGGADGSDSPPVQNLGEFVRRVASSMRALR